MDCGRVGLTVYHRDLPGAAADAAKAPTASTQGSVGKVSTTPSAGAIASFGAGDRASTIEHSYDRSRPGHSSELENAESAPDDGRLRWPVQHLDGRFATDARRALHEIEAQLRQIVVSINVGM